MNRGLTTETVLNYLRTKLPQQYELAEVVGKWVWLDVSPARKPMLAKVLWALGFHWNQRRGVWQHPCGKFDPLGSASHRPARQVSLLFSRRCHPRLKGIICHECHFNFARFGITGEAVQISRPAPTNSK